MPQGHTSDTGDKYTDRRGVMWCGEVTRIKVIQMLNLQKDLRHPMESVVLLTENPYLQVHIPKDKVVLSMNNISGCSYPPPPVLPPQMM